MKKLSIYISLIIFVCSTRAIFAQPINKNQNLNLPIEPVAIAAPLSLPIWYPFGSPEQIIVAGPSMLRYIVPFVTPLAGKVSDMISGAPESPTPPDPSIIPVNYDKQGYAPLMDHEEILYDINFENTAQTPIHLDTVISIIIPDGLRYIQNSFQLNDKNLSDEDDNDELKYIGKKSLLKIDLNRLSQIDKPKITFSAKILDKTKIENKPFCFVKFESRSNNINTDYIPFPDF